jgi:hypothetical protein
MDAKKLTSFYKINSNSINELTTTLSQTYINYSNVFPRPHIELRLQIKVNKPLKVKINDKVASIIHRRISAKL